MAVHNTSTRVAAILILLIAGIFVITASAVTWQVHETACIQGTEKVLMPLAVIYVDAGAGLQYYPNVTPRSVNPSYLQAKATAMPYKRPNPVPSLPSGTSISATPTGTPVTPGNAYLPGFSGKLPVRQNTTKTQKFPLIQSKPVVLKPLPIVKPTMPVGPLPTFFLPDPAQPIPSTIIVDDSTRQVEQLILYYTNIERTNSGKTALIWDEQLAIIGRDHCVDMAAKGFFNHVNLEGETPADRALRHGYQIEKDFGAYVRVGVGENIAMVSNYPGTEDEVARFIVNAWMNSPGHRANIIDSNEQKFTLIGVGVAYDQVTATWYAAQEFF